MRLIFWGVRGSIVTPEIENAAYGGNTPCAEVRLDERRSILLDAGMGLRWQSRDMLSRQNSGNVQEILLSHCHWDHIQGIPFSPLMYLPDNQVSIRGPGLRGESLRSNLSEQLRPEFCPVPNFFQKNIGAEISVTELTEGADFDCLGVQVRWALLPRGRQGLVAGYRLDHPNFSLAYITDVEYPDGPAQCPQALELAGGVDILIHDAQFTDNQRSQRQGRGHSSHSEALELARLVGAGRLICCHHDPHSNDADLEQVEASLSQSGFSAQLAREGLVLELTS